MISLETNILIKTLICKHVLIEHKSATLFLPQFIRKYQPWMLKKDKQVREKILLQAIFIQDNRRPTSNRSLSASISTASCSSPKELTHAVPPQEAVLTLKEMVLKASPMHVSNLINPLSGVALVRNSSYNHKLLFIFKQAISQIPCSHYYTNALTRLSPISHLVLRERSLALMPPLLMTWELALMTLQITSSLSDSIIQFDHEPIIIKL